MHIAEIIIIALLSVIVGGFGWDKYLLWKNSTKHFSDQITSRHEVYKLMAGVTKSTSSKRFLILKTTNGGGKPKVGSKIYASVLYEDVYHPFKSVINIYTRVVVDGEYVNMLRKVALDGFVSLDVPNMNPGLLREIYESEGVFFSQIFYLHETAEAFYYCSVATDETGVFGMTTKPEQLTIRLTVDKLRNIFKKIK